MITEDELEWFQKYQEERAYKEEASFESGVRAKIEYEAEQRGIRKSVLAICDILSPEEIAKRFKMELDDVQSIIESAKGKQQ